MRLVTRAQWGARPPDGAYSTINSTVTTGHWEGPNLWGTAIGSHDSCAPKVRAIQDYHMDQNGWTDIAYNAVACPHGYVFEGRGPGRRSAANGTNSANDQSAVCCYLGGEGDLFTVEGQQAMTDAAAWLGDPMQKGHRDWIATACPGDVIYGWIKSGSAPGPPSSPPQSPGSAPPFPYPGDHYLGQARPDPKCHSGYYPSDQPHVSAWQGQMAARGWGISVDGSYGPQSEGICRQFQAEKGLSVDGLVGPQTWGTTWTAAVT